MRADGILFDKDGTLFHFARTWESWAGAFIGRLAGGDGELAGAIGAAIGFDHAGGRFTRDSLAIAGTPDQMAGALEAILDLPAGEIEALMNEEAARVEQHEAVPLAPLLARLSALGLKLGVATNDAEAPARAHLEAAGVIGHFDYIAGYDSGHGGKPDPGMCTAFARACSLTPERVVMVGDSRHDLVAGRRAGMQVVAVLTGLAGDDELAGLADAVLPDIGHLPDWLAR